MALRGDRRVHSARASLHCRRDARRSRPRLSTFGRDFDKIRLPAHSLNDRVGQPADAGLCQGTTEKSTSGGGLARACVFCVLKFTYLGAQARGCAGALTATRGRLHGRSMQSAPIAAQLQRERVPVNPSRSNADTSGKRSAYLSDRRQVGGQGPGKSRPLNGQ